jgi:hypothetical protein
MRRLRLSVTEKQCVNRQNDSLTIRYGRSNPKLCSPITSFSHTNNFFLNLHGGEWSPNWVHSARRPLTGLLYLPWVIVRMEKLVE